MKFETTSLESGIILFGHVHKVVDLYLVVHDAVDFVCLPEHFIVELSLSLLKQGCHLPLEVMEISHHLAKLGIGFLGPLDIALPLLFIDMDKLLVVLVCPLQFFKHPNHFLPIVLYFDVYFLNALVMVVKFGTEWVLFFV